MLSLYNSEKFQKELSEYKKIIITVDDLNVKSQLENFVNKLILEVKSFDKEHEMMIFSKNMQNGSSSREKILELRKTLDRKIKDWKESQRLKAKQKP
jgi:hypothetical protein